MSSWGVLIICEVCLFEPFSAIPSGPYDLSLVRSVLAGAKLTLQNVLILAHLQQQQQHFFTGSLCESELLENFLQGPKLRDCNCGQSHSTGGQSRTS